MAAFFSTTESSYNRLSASCTEMTGRGDRLVHHLGQSSQHVVDHVRYQPGAALYESRYGCRFFTSLGAYPKWALNARLNAASEAYPVR
jgi:hypothetical protein